jgi:tetratricopeptide (TPR) repeat protein
MISDLYIKRFFTIICVVVIGTSSCSLFKRSANEQSSDANAATTAPSYPVFTDANEALNEGNRLLDENQTEASIDALRQAVKINPDLAEAWFHLGIAYSLLELQMAQSGAVTETAADVPANGKAAKTKTNSEKAFEKAVEAYRKWIETNPDDDVAQYNLGRTYSKLMKDEESEKSFRQAVKLKPDDTEYQTELGAILIKLARYREAIDPLKKAVALDETNERAQELLEDAEAGRQRLDYVAPKNTNTNSTNANSNVNSNSAANSNSNSNSAARTPEANTKPKKEPTKRPSPPANRPE